MTTRTVVTGIGIVSPVGLTRDSTWQNLLRGVSGIGHISSFDPEELETTIAGEVKGFEPTEYMTRKDARRMDRFSQLAVAASREAIDQADMDSADERVSVMVASGIGGIITLSEQIGVMSRRGPRRVSPFLVPMMLPDMASGHVSMSIGATGPNYSTVSACASGGDAIGQAQLLLHAGAADIVVAGGAEAAICPIGLAGFNSVKALSRRNAEPQKASRPFDALRDGFVLGEGAAVLVLETLESAHERGAQPIAEMAGLWIHVRRAPHNAASSRGGGGRKSDGSRLGRCGAPARGSGLRQRARHVDASQRPQRDPGDEEGLWGRGVQDTHEFHEVHDRSFARRPAALWRRLLQCLPS